MDDTTILIGFSVITIILIFLILRNLLKNKSDEPDSKREHKRDVENLKNELWDLKAQKKKLDSIIYELREENNRLRKKLNSLKDTGPTCFRISLVEATKLGFGIALGMLLFSIMLWIILIFFGVSVLSLFSSRF